MEKRTEPDRPNPTSMYCNNCGGKGHLFRTCTDPVLSCGIILLDKPKLPCQDASILMIRRKDSMSFAEFMRGKYDPRDLEYVSVLVRNMTLKEQSLIACEPFEVLWRQMWGEERTSSPEFAQSREKFYQLNRVELMRQNLSVYTEPEWGFPKGRRMRGESDMDCAVREFGEETNIPRTAYTILKRLRLTETFNGLNGVRYCHIYFVALLTDPTQVHLLQKFTPMQRREISGIGWKTFDEAIALIRPHYEDRQQMLAEMQSWVGTFETDP